MAIVLKTSSPQTRGTVLEITHPEAMNHRGENSRLLGSGGKGFKPEGDEECGNLDSVLSLVAYFSVKQLVGGRQVVLLALKK